MSEFPEWVEDCIGFHSMTYEESLELHRKIKAVYDLIPDIEERLARPNPRWPHVPFDRKWPWWRRYLWYCAQ